MQITRDEIISRYTDIETEIIKTESWFDDPLTFSLSTEPISAYDGRVHDSMIAYEHHPASKSRMLAIRDDLLSGASPWPIFQYAEDGFLLEGWHRIVAIHLAGFETVEVISVGKIDCDPEGFDANDVALMINRDDWSVSARWRGRQIGFVRVNMDDPMPDNGRRVENTFVLPAFRRRGIASRLYDAAEEMVGDIGLRLVPSPQPILSQNALGLWLKRNPDVVSDTRAR